MRTVLREQMADVTITANDLAALFKALAHPKRLAILQELRGVERCVCEIEDALDLRQAYVSQQLTVLREAGLVCYRKDGWNVYYRIARPEVYTLLELATVIHSELGTCATLGPGEANSAECDYVGTRSCGCRDNKGETNDADNEPTTNKPA